MLHPLLSKQFRTNDCNYHYYCLTQPVSLDTVFASTVTSRGSMCEQVYATDFGQSRVHPKASRRDPYETLALLFARDGVPLSFIHANDKEIIKGKFY